MGAWALVLLWGGGAPPEAPEGVWSSAAEREGEARRAGGQRGWLSRTVADSGTSRSVAPEGLLGEAAAAGGSWAGA